MPAPPRERAGCSERCQRDRLLVFHQRAVWPDDEIHCRMQTGLPALDEINDAVDSYMGHKRPWAAARTEELIFRLAEEHPAGCHERGPDQLARVREDAALYSKTCTNASRVTACAGTLPEGVITRIPRCGESGTLNGSAHMSSTDSSAATAMPRFVGGPLRARSQRRNL
jgi:hypothetical protein